MSAAFPGPLPVVIVNFHSSVLVSELVDRLPAWAQPVIVDNSADAQEAARLATIERATVVVAEENVGFAGGVNLGVAAIDTSGWILLLNPDATIAPEALERLCSGARSALFDVASPFIVNGFDHTIWYGGGSVDPRWVTPVHQGFGAPLPDLLGGEPYPTDFVPGCIMLLSPRAVAELLPLREDLFMYWEDVDLCLRARDRSLSLGVVPDAVGEHPKGVHRTSDFHYYRMRNRLMVARSSPSLSLGKAMMGTPVVLLKELRFIVRSRQSMLSRFSAACLGSLHGALGVGAGRRRGGMRRAPLPAPAVPTS
jgi:N-acetylglucosaminyl-diphospho-decaprenol L-rhamnosyltransferase